MTCWTERGLQTSQPGNSFITVLQLWPCHYVVLDPSNLWAVPGGWFKSPSRIKGVKGWKNGFETEDIHWHSFSCTMDKEIINSKLVEVIEAASALLSVIRKLSSSLETALETHLSPLVIPMSLQPCIWVVSVVGQHIQVGIQTQATNFMPKIIKNKKELFCFSSARGSEHAVEGPSQ